MNRTTTLTVAAAAVLGAVVACQPTSTTAGSSDGASSQPTVNITIHSVATSHAGPSKTATQTKASTKPTPAKSCPAVDDIIVWYRVPTLPDSAQRLGGADPITCELTFNWLQRTSPMGDGYCTEAAWAHDNPGYDDGATPARRLKKVQMWAGPGC